MSSGGDFRIQNSQFRITNMITYKVSKVKNPGKNAVEGTQYFAAKALLKKTNTSVSSRSARDPSQMFGMTLDIKL